MSLSQKVLALVAGIDNPKVRFDIMSTVNFLFNLFISGRVNEEQLRGDLFEICLSVLTESSPELTEEEIRKRASMLADELVRTMKIEGVSKRALARFARLPF